MLLVEFSTGSPDESSVELSTASSDDASFEEKTSLMEMSFSLAKVANKSKSETIVIAAHTLLSLPKIAPHYWFHSNLSS